MSKVLYVCARSPSLTARDDDRLGSICRALEPDNIASRVHHRIVSDTNTAFAVMNHSPSIVEKGKSLLLGCLYEPCEEWDKPLSPRPDGSYALFRCNETHVEVATDAAASRTIWYYFDARWFVASMSQRAIVMFLGSFHFDDRVIPWLLSTGSLGPEFSWDRRLKRLPVDSSVVLDRRTWSLSMQRTPVIFQERDCAEEDHKRLLDDAITRTIESFDSLNRDHWVLPLTGGYDSRAILCWLVKTGEAAKGLRTITWGLEGAINEKGNDAKVAKDLAGMMKVEHKYYHIDSSKEPVRNVIDRFLHCGEGRIDHIAGYLDGLKIWGDLVDDGVAGIIRGDMGFGWMPVSSELTVRYHIDCALCTDYENLADVSRNYDLPRQVFPEELARGDESWSAWRDRLYHTYRIPVIKAALSDIKFSYMEQVSPLLSRAVLARVREQPDGLRTGKILFKRLASSVSPDIPYARKAAVVSPEDAFRESSMIELLRDELQDDYARRLLNARFLDHIVGRLDQSGRSRSGTGDSLKKRIVKRMPRSIKNFVRDRGASSLSIDPNRLAFRVYIVIRMHQLLTTDSCRTT